MPIVGHHVHHGNEHRAARYEEAAAFSEAADLWLYWNVRLLHGDLAFAGSALGPPCHLTQDLDEVTREAESLVLTGKILVWGVHNPAVDRLIESIAKRQWPGLASPAAPAHALS